MTLRTDVETIVRRLPDAIPGRERFVIAIAGPPAAGKSTLAAALIDALDGRAALLGMDGFHFDNSILDARQQRQRKGAPHTFDVASYSNTLRRLRDDPSIEMSVPVFDRSLDVALNCASMVNADHRIIVTEGNYLLLDERPWSDLAGLFDLTVWLDVRLDAIEARILERWSGAGVDPEEVHRRCHQNDLPNARLTHASSRSADIIVGNSITGPSLGSP